jgi:GLPGLI family protein
MLRYLFIIIFLFLHYVVVSQNHIIERGSIIFERKINTHAILPEIIGESGIVAKDDLPKFFQKYKAEHPQFWLDSFKLIFGQDSTLYQPAGTISPFLHGTGVPMAEKNEVLIDLTRFQYIAEKNAYNEPRVISDSFPRIRWKLTDETLDIAGFECRRANALINDSVYVVAFYTDAIKTKGGPELFNGLPGMILGVAIPHYHISYFATRVDTHMSSEKRVTPTFIYEKAKIKLLDYCNVMINYLKDKKLDSPWMKVFIRL